jgi:hypothetical protein
MARHQFLACVVSALMVWSQFAARRTLLSFLGGCSSVQAVSALQ